MVQQFNIENVKFSMPDTIAGKGFDRHVITTKGVYSPALADDIGKVCNYLKKNKIKHFVMSDRKLIMMCRLFGK